MIRYLILIAMLLPLAANAQKHYKNPAGKRNGAEVVFTMDVDASQVKPHSRTVTILTPVVSSGDKIKEFPSIAIYGKNRYKADKRAQRFSEKLPYSVENVVKKGETKHYNKTISYEEWMDGGNISIKQTTWVCSNGMFTQPNESILSLPVMPVMPQGKPVVSYVVPQVEQVKNRNLQERAYLDYQAGKSVIIANFSNNAQELNKITSMIDMLRSDNSVVFNTITLRGYASPEGSVKLNEHLSLQRSLALKGYLKKMYAYPENMFQVSSEGEDWAGLRTLVMASEAQGKDEIIRIIDKPTNLEDTERELKSLNSGVTYKELLDNYFPQLRCVKYKLDYTVRAFSVEEGVEVIKTNPKNMSLSEMYMVAETYSKGSDRFNDVFKIAVKEFPDDPVANINAAATALDKGDLAAAHSYLDRFTNTPESWNNQGVLYMLEGDFTKSREFFIKAKDNGVAEASKNLTLMEQLQDYQASKATYHNAIGQ